MTRTMTNYEEVIYKFTPALRSQAAKLMISEFNVSQERAAELLGTTQAAISKYINTETSKEISKIEKSMDNYQLRLFVSNVVVGNTLKAQKSACKLCQTHKKFDCSLMVK